MRTRAFIGACLVALTLVVPAAMAESPDHPVAPEEVPALELDKAEMDLPRMTPEPGERFLEPCTAADGSAGTYFCTGSTCTNGQQCAECCSSDGVNCGPLTCVDNCIWPR